MRRLGDDRSRRGCPAPEGDTYTTTGNGELRKLCTIWRIEVSSPPGVSSSTSSIPAPPLSACARASASSPATTGVMGPTTRATSTDGASWARAGTATRSSPTIATTLAATRRVIL